MVGMQRAERVQRGREEQETRRTKGDLTRREETLSALIEISPSHIARSTSLQSPPWPSFAFLCLRCLSQSLATRPITLGLHSLVCLTLDWHGDTRKNRNNPHYRVTFHLFFYVAVTLPDFVNNDADGMTSCAEIYKNKHIYCSSGVEQRTSDGCREVKRLRPCAASPSRRVRTDSQLCTTASAPIA